LVGLWLAFGWPLVGLWLAFGWPLVGLWLTALRLSLGCPEVGLGTLDRTHKPMLKILILRFEIKNVKKVEKTTLLSTVDQTTTIAAISI
jgi:hypothetical protein